MVKHDDYLLLRQRCRQVVNGVDQVETLEGIRAGFIGEGTSDAEIERMGFNLDNAPRVLQVAIARRMKADRDKLLDESIEQAVKELDGAIESLRSVASGFAVVPETFTTEPIMIASIGEFEKWLLECAAAEVPNSQKAILLRLVMGAVAQFKDGVKPEDLRLAIPYGKMPMVVMCPNCKEPFNTGYDEAGVFVTQSVESELEADALKDDSDFRQMVSDGFQPEPVYSIETWSAERSKPFQPVELALNKLTMRDTNPQ